MLVVEWYHNDSFLFYCVSVRRASCKKYSSFCHPFMDVMYNYSKAMIKSSLEIDKIMKKLENTFQDASLMKKALLGDASDEEQLVLEQRLSNHPELKAVYEKLQDSEELKDAFNKYKEYSSEKAYEHFLQQIQQKENSSAGKIRRIRTWWYAAAVMVVLAVGVSFYAVNRYQAMEETGARIAQIKPGSKQAVLTLPDGSTIDVQKKDINVIVDGVQVKYNKGVLSYRPTVTTQQKQQEEKNVDESPVKSNELVIPRGGENTVLLADGTTVHLNAGSKLIYPVRFVGKRRIVTLEGEAYFDVRKDEEHPFVVRTRLGEVTVLGTAFNVNAYNDADVCYTTLVYGKVNFSTPDQKTITLAPGEQAIASSRGIEKRAVDVNEYIGWARGVYVFNNKRLGDIMKTFERWYDVHVYYEKESLCDLTYSGDLQRYGTINTFLNALELTGDIYYKINGRNILIYENE